MLNILGHHTIFPIWSSDILGHWVFSIGSFLVFLVTYLSFILCFGLLGYGKCAMIGLLDLLVHCIVFHGWLCWCEAGTWATERSLPSQQEATHRPPPPLTVTITDISNIANQTPRLFQYIPTHKLLTPEPASTLAVIRILNLHMNKYIHKGYCWGTSPFPFILLLLKYQT